MIKPSDTQPASNMMGGMLALLVVARMLLPGMAEYSMWYDEVQVFRAAEALKTLNDFYRLEGFPARIVHPPFFFALLKLWMTVIGKSDFALRALPALSAIITAAFVYRATVDLSGQSAGGIAAAVIFGGMGFGSYYIHETHNYSLFMTESAMMLFFYNRWWNLPRPRYAAGIVLATLMLAYTHYTSVYLILAFNVHALLTGISRIRHWIVLQLMAALAYSPWLLTVYWIITRGYSQTEAPSVIGTSMPTSGSAVAMTMRLLLYDGWPYYATWLAFGAMAAAVRPVHPYRRVVRACGLLLLVGGGSFLLTLMGNSIWQVLAARRVIYLLVFVAGLLGYVFAHLPARLRWGALVVFLILTPDQPLRDGLTGNWFYRQSIEYVADHARPGDAVFINLSGALDTVPFRHYAELLLPNGIPFQTADDPPEAKLNTYLPRERIWVIWHQDDEEPVVWWNDGLKRKLLVETQRHQAAHFRVSLYSVPAGRPITSLAYINPAGVALPQVFGAQFELMRCEVDRLDVGPGEWITVNLDWRALRPIQQDWAIFVHLIEDDFVTLHGQGDSTPMHLGVALSPLYWPVGAAIYDQHKLTVDLGTPPGMYNLRVGIYSRDQGYRLRVEPGDGVSGDDGVIIAQIHVR